MLSQVLIFLTLFRRKCGSSDFRARRDDVKWEKSFAYKNLKWFFYFWYKNWFFFLKNISKIANFYLCLNVRSATASKKKNKNVKNNRSIKSTTKTVFCHVDWPNASSKIWTQENDVFSSSKAGISRKLISDESDEFMAA